MNAYDKPYLQRYSYAFVDIDSDGLWRTAIKRFGRDGYQLREFIPPTDPQVAVLERPWSRADECSYDESDPPP